MVAQPSYTIFPTGRRTFQFDVSDHIAEQVGNLTVSSASWTLPSEITGSGDTHTNSTVTITIETSGLELRQTYEGICSVTFSDSQVHQFIINFVVGYLNVKVAT
ncbi:MAG: hypothetical protein AAF528_01225 [Cyanobacteria bacterium P01_C01_bin.121]